jgi:hypothetical protein
MYTLREGPYIPDCAARLLCYMLVAWRSPGRTPPGSRLEEKDCGLGRWTRNPEVRI